MIKKEWIWMNQLNQNKMIKLKDMDSNDLRDELASRGFYTNNLWHVDDVKQNYECSDEDAQEILDKTMQSEWITQEIFTFIDEVCVGHAHTKEK